MKNWINSILKLDSCSNARNWMATPDVAAMTFSQAWAACERGDWMLWLAERVGVGRKALVLAACACAREALCYVPADEERPRIAIETAERWARGEATIEEVRIAKNAAEVVYAASYALYAAAAYAVAEYDTAYYASFNRSAKLVRSIISAEMVEACGSF